jgi:hypothetical protein
MPEDTTPPPTPGQLLSTFLTLLAAHRAAFRQARPYHRVVALALGWLGTLGRHTITQVLVSLGLGTSDWSGFYRLFGTPRFDYARLTADLLRATLPLASADRPYVVAIDGVRVPRESRTMPGTGWLLAAGTAPFKRGLRRAQRFVDCDWLPQPSAQGYSRAVPLRWEPAFPPKAVPAPDHPACKEWEAGLAGLRHIRADLDAAGRTTQRLLGVADGAYSNQHVWQDKPERTDLLARCARNRALFALPTEQPKRGRHRQYGQRAPRPDAWLTERTGWHRTQVPVRGRTIPLTYRVEGPYLVKGAPAQPLFLLVVRGIAKRSHRHQRREPAFWLISAVPTDTADHPWRLPLPAPDLLAWAWQRWEVEVAHREQKTTFGLGEPQCWGPRSAVVAVQWVGWLYALTVLTGLQTWGLGHGTVPPPGRWWRGSGRWSLAQLWSGLRTELWQLGDFQPVWSRTTGTWTEMTDWLATQTNTLRGSSRT